MENGLPDSTVYSLTHDANGFLWLATPSGLARYNGHFFENFGTTSGTDAMLVSQSAGTLLIDSQQRIWVGTWGDGLFLFDKNLNLITQFNHDKLTANGLNSNLIQTLYEDSEGDIWIGTNGGGLSLYQDNSERLLRFARDANPSRQIAHNRVWDITEGLPGQIWVGTGNGLNKIDKTDNFKIDFFNNACLQDCSVDNKVRSLLYDKNLTLWLGSQSGLLKLLPGETTYSAVKSAADDSPITSLVQGKDNDIWIGTQSGVVKYNADKTLPPSSSYLPNDDVRDLLYDSSGILWVAARPSGLVKLIFSKDAFEKYSDYVDKNGKLTSFGRAQTVLADQQDRVWIGSNDGLYLLNTMSNEIQRVGNIPNQQLGLITTSLQRSDGSLWFAGSKGVFNFNETSGELELTSIALPDKTNMIVNTLYEDSSKRLWIGTANNGLFYLHNNKTVPFRLSEIPLISDKSVNAIAEEKPGHMLIGVSGQGMFRFAVNSKSYTQYTTDPKANSLSSNQVTQIFRSSDNQIWLATNHGLNRFHPTNETFSTFDEQSGIANHIIKAIASDQQNQLWFSTALGVYRYSSTQNLFTQYTAKHGLHGNSFMVHSATKAPNGDLYFGGDSGLSRIKVSSIESASKAPNITLTSVVIDDIKEQQLEFTGLPDRKLEHGVKDIAFHFSELDFIGVDNVTFSHRLIGHNEKWSKPHTNLQVTYSGLSDGDYKFEVRSFVNGVWSNSSATYTFCILPPWWKTWWVISLLVILIAVAVHFFNLRRTRKLLKQNEQLERQVVIRSKELVLAQKQLTESEKNSALSSLVTGVAHELNTPVGISVTAASLLLEQIKSLHRDFTNKKITRSEFERVIESMTTSSEMIFNNLQRTASLVSRFKGISVDQIPLQKKQINLHSYLNEIFDGLISEHKLKDLQFDIDCPQNYLINSYPGAIGQLITQLTLNSVEHGFSKGASGIITVKVRQNQRTTHLHFEDNGKGIPDSIRERIFEPFFTTNRHAGGNGLGLQIAANIVTIRLGGEISCYSSEGRFTRFDIHFPSDSI